MALRTLNIELDNLKREPFNRLDVKFYLVNNFFDKIASKYHLAVEPISKLKESVISGSYIDTYTDKENGIPYLRVADIKPFSFDENEEDLAYVSKSVAEKIKIKENDILVARTQATIDKLGTASIADKSIAGWATSQHTTRITVDKKKISPLYLIAYLNSKFFKAQTALASHGDTRVEMTHSQLNQVRVFIPEKKLLEAITQKVEKIVKYNREALDLIEDAKKVLYKSLKFDERMNAKKEKYFSVNLDSFLETDIWNPSCHLPFYEVAASQIKKHNSIKLGEIAIAQRGHEPGSANYIIYLDKKDGYIPFIRTSDIINYETDLFPDYYLEKSVCNQYIQDIKPNDILFTKDGKIGSVALVMEDDNIFLQSHIFRLRLKDTAKKHNITSEYLFACLSLKEIGLYQSKRFTVIQSTIPTIANRIYDFHIPVFSKKVIDEVSQKIERAFVLKRKRKNLITEVINQIDNSVPFKI